MGLLEELGSMNANIEEGLQRFVNNAALYEKMLKKFPSVARIPVLEPLKSGDVETAIASVHNLKGMTGNLSLTPLYEGYLESLGLLREGKADEAQVILEALMPVQEEFLACIEKYN